MWCIISEDRADLPRHLAIDIKPSRNEDQSRALPLGGNGGHSRAHTEWTGFVTGRRHHAPRARAANGHRLTPQFGIRSEEHTSELQSLMRTSYAVFCLKKKK